MQLILVSSYDSQQSNTAHIRLQLRLSTKQYSSCSLAVMIVNKSIQLILVSSYGSQQKQYGTYSLAVMTVNKTA